MSTPDPETQRAIDLSLSKSSPSSPNIPSTCPSPSKTTTDTYKRTRESSTRESSIIILNDTDDDDDDAPPTKRKRVDIIQEKNARAQARRDESEPKGTLPMDRKAMEAERLKRAQSAARAAAAEKRTEKSAVPSEPASFYSTGDRAVAASRAVKSPGRAPGLEKIPLKEDQEPERMKLRFPDGAVKKTWEGGDSLEADEITIEDVLEKQTLQTAVLSAFQFHLEWIMQRLPLQRLRSDFRLHMVMQGNEPGDRAMKEQILGDLPGVSLVFPPMAGQVKCMHSKLMLLFQKRGKDEWLRIGIPTANLTDYDWGYRNGIMENMIFLIDLPKLKDVQPEQTFFMKELLHFCAAKGISEQVLSQIVSYDFAKTAPLAFVHSIGGSHIGLEKVKRTGYPGLGEAVKTLGLQSGKGLEVDYVTSSLGAAKAEFIADMYRAAQGHNGLRDFQRRMKMPTKTKGNGNAEDDSTADESELEEEKDWEAVARRFRIFFPSKESVEKSRGGMPSGGTICFQRPWWNAVTFPKQLVRDCESVRTRQLMHNKLLFARPAKELNGKAGKAAAWAYVGSANLSESAWGKLVMDRATKSPKINLRNWECGVIIPLLPHTAFGGQTLSGEMPPESWPVEMKHFEKVVPVPMKYPGEPMAHNAKTPWFFCDQAECIS